MIKCAVNNCDSIFKQQLFYRKHLAEYHDLILEKEEYIFQSIIDFQIWKENLEKSEKSSYRLMRTRAILNGKKMYYSCHRSGMPILKQNKSKAPRAQGSCKIGVHCPSTMEVTNNKKIHVIFYKTHVGHEMELQHLHLSSSIKSELNRKLSEGVSLSRCLDDVKDTLTNNFERDHFITRKDLHNIAKSNSIFKKEQRHPSDPISVDLFVREVQELGQESPVLFYKQQGISSTSLEFEDFCLILASPAQREMLKMFGGDKICIDSTHGTNIYDFQLTTILVVDEFNCGFPVAFCISNRVDQIQMQLFFEVIRDNICLITSNVFMSDDAPAYYNAWKDIMGQAEKQLLCTWHVDRNWRKALNKIKSKEKQIHVYKYARTLLEELDENQFQLLLNSFLQELEMDEETKNFGIYFQSHYASKSKLWAYCYRVNAGINTNMYAESFHRVLKHIYMQGKKCKRIDACLSHLLKLVKNRTWDRFTKLIKGSYSKRIMDINSRHRRGLELCQDLIKCIHDKEWQVTSEECLKVAYCINKNIECTQCKIKCGFCHICIHTYTCTCIDYSIKLNICKHIHAVHCMQTNVEATNKINISNERSTIQDIQQSESFKSIIKDNINKDYNCNKDLKMKLELALDLVKTNSFTSDEEKAMHKHVDAIISLSSKRESNCTSVNKEPPNKKLNLQKRFNSTKKNKTKQNAKLIINKPSCNYKISVIESINESSAVNIHNENDHSYASK